MFLIIIYMVILLKTAYTEHISDEVNPFLVKIEAKGKILDCAGTILTPCTVLTSAYCVEGVDSALMTVSHITDKVTKYEVASTVIHPMYNSTVLANDIALLEIKSVFQEPWETITVNSFCEEEVFSKCNFFQIVGWSGHILIDPDKNDTGFLEKPMKAPIKLISNENCGNLIKTFGGVFQGEGKLCGVSDEEDDEEGCFTGPGGPLLCSFQSKVSVKTTQERNSHFKQNIDRKGVLAEPIDLLESFKWSEEKKFKREMKNEVKNLQVGVVSWGKTCSKVPSVYMKTDFYFQWITETATKISKKCAPHYKSIDVWTPLSSKGTEKSQNFFCFSFMLFSTSITVSLQFSTKVVHYILSITVLLRWFNSFYFIQ